MNPIAFIVAAGSDGGIGKDNKLLWKIPSDLANFVKVTKHKPVIMGRKTYESIGKSLPNRFNIVISSTDIDGVTTVRTPAEALEKAENYWKNTPNSDTEKEIMVIGGATVYKTFEDIVEKVYLTTITAHTAADTWFDNSFLIGPDVPKDTWQVLESRQVQEDAENPAYTYTVYQKAQQSLNF